MKTVELHEVEAVVDADGSVRIDHLPFPTGDRVRVLVLRDRSDAETDHARSQAVDRYPLRGRGPYQFDDPLGPVAVEDWESLK